MASSILLLLLASVAASQNTCYYPDGSVPELDEGTFVPCPGTQSCCVSGDTCLNDGQCFSHTLPAVYVGACQVQNWAQATSCASFQTDYTAQWTWIVPCSDGEICFQHTSDFSCCKGDSVFLLANTARYTPLATQATATSTVTVTGSDAGATTQAGVSQKAKETDKSKSTTNVGAIVGGVVGGLLAGAILGGAGIWFMAYRKRKRDSQSSPAPYQVDYKQGYQHVHEAGSRQHYPELASEHSVSELPSAAK